MSLRQLLDLQKEVISFTGHHLGTELPLTVEPKQFSGIELNVYAHELAQITIWIGYLQWRKENGLFTFDEPILQPLKNIRRVDAILALNKDKEPYEPSWPEVEVIIGNPPFLGSRKIRTSLGEQYWKGLKKLYSKKFQTWYVSGF